MVNPPPTPEKSTPLPRRWQLRCRSPGGVTGQWDLAAVGKGVVDLGEDNVWEDRQRWQLHWGGGPPEMATSLERAASGEIAAKPPLWLNRVPDAANYDDETTALSVLCRNFVKPKFPEKTFTYRHLAQLKFLLPEAIEIKRTLVHNERTLCMEQDLQITMNLGCEVPVAMLPEPFDVEQDLHSDSTRIPPSTDQVCDGISGEMQPVLSSENENPNSEPFLGTVAASEMAFATQYSYFTRDFALEATTKKLMNTHQIPRLWPPLKPPIDSDALLCLNTVSSEQIEFESSGDEAIHSELNKREDDGGESESEQNEDEEDDDGRESELSGDENINPESDQEEDDGSGSESSGSVSIDSKSEQEEDNGGQFESKGREAIYSESNQEEHGRTTPHHR
ncbi:hypothetical protein TIFTF001_040811 [Ficus carica]|uniref:Uncharacterized protein n=1 Tax=Ficus carica TaxID=3494 RepID=A0AA87Z5S4_FICCA|nr:hypothetical protein TIFTF001_040811 [Ficus carica]